MGLRTRYSITASIIGVITLVMMPMVLCAQGTAANAAASEHPVQRTFTAPEVKQKSEHKALAANESRTHMVSEIEPRIDIIEVKAGNENHIPAGFYASYKPPTYDTVYIYEGATDQFEIINIHANKEVISGDSASVAEEVNFRMNHLNEEGIPVTNEKHGKTNTMIIRSGFIPAQGFGSKRFRFAVKPGEFGLNNSSMISASVHILDGSNIGTILCAVTSIDYKKGVFYVETSNEVPKGENINWIIVNNP